MHAPPPILWFSRLWIGSTIASIVVAVATWGDLIKDLPKDDVGEAANYGVAFAYAASVGVSFLLWWLIMRRRSATARTIATVLSVIGAILVAVTLAEPYLGGAVDPDTRAVGWRIAENAAVAVGLVANALLFAPGARYWFTRDPEFSDVFS